MNKRANDFYFAAVLLGITILIIFVFFYSLNFLSDKVELEQSKPVIFRDITIQDRYNSTFQLDITFTTEKPDFIVKEKINVHATLKRIHNNSIYPLTLIYLALVTSEGHQMPYQGGQILGEIMDKTDNDFFIVDYDTYLYVSSKYSCRLIIYYYNTTNISLVKIESDEIIKGPLFEVYSTAVALQIEMNALQRVANNRTIGLALIVVILTLITILITWIDKYEKLFFKLDNFFNQNKYGKENHKYLKNTEIKQKEKDQNIKSWENDPAFVKRE